MPLVLVKFTQARGHIPAKVDHHNIRPLPLQLMFPPNAARRDHRFLRKRRQTTGIFCHENIAGTGTRERGRDLRSRRQFTREILRAVNSDINFPRQQRAFDLRCEKAFASGTSKIFRGRFISTGPDDSRDKANSRAMPANGFTREFRLCKRKIAPARSDHEFVEHFYFTLPLEL